MFLELLMFFLKESFDVLQDHTTGFVMANIFKAIQTDLSSWILHALLFPKNTVTWTGVASHIDIT